MDPVLDNIHRVSMDGGRSRTQEEAGPIIAIEGGHTDVPLFPTWIVGVAAVAIVVVGIPVGMALFGGPSTKTKMEISAD